MKVMIAPARPAKTADVCNALSVAGLHDVRVTTSPDQRLEVSCEDYELDLVIAAIMRDDHLESAMICAKNASGRITDLVSISHQVF